MSVTVAHHASQKSAPVVTAAVDVPQAAVTDPAARAEAAAAVFESRKAASAAPSAPAVASPRDVAERYFTALNARDAKTLDAVYANGARFDDNVFHHATSAGILAMWSKLPADAQVKHEILKVEGNTVTAKLDWDYTLFGKKVHNAETSRLTVIDGKITAQAEHFDFGTWAHQLAPLVPRSLLNFAEPVLAPLLGMVG